MEFRFIKECEISQAVELINREFDNKIAPFYSKEGIDSFKAFCQFPFFHKMFVNKEMFMIGCFDEKLIGVICIRDHHISALFVDSLYCHQGIGSKLLDKAKLLVCGDISVNAFYKVYEFYLQNGFKGQKEIVEKDGIKYIPMFFKHENKFHFQSYKEVQQFISSLKQRVYALDHFKKFMQELCNPQNELKTIHIGGTNGKGSTVNYIREVLQQAGYKVATFTSPALISPLDIIRINNIYITDEEIVRYANQYTEICVESDLSMFELEVLLAVMYFRDQKVDYAIFEVGLGGELDATNIINPLVSVNTNIGLDHVQFLGDTYEKIARTKGGIIKDNTAFIVGEKKQECLSIFKELCNKHHAPFIQVKDISNINYDYDTVSFDYDVESYRLFTSANYQCYNAGLAIEVLHYLRKQNYVCFKDDELKKAIFEAKWDGRFEVLRKEPLIIVDGAHNKEGIEQFCNAASKYPQIKVIFSALKDKDTHHMIERLLELTDDLTICEFDHYRAQKAELLAENFNVKIEKNWQKAIDNSFDYQGTLFITGSLYFISKVRPYILNKCALIGE